MQKISKNFGYKSDLNATKTNSIDLVSLSNRYRTYKCLICQKLFSQKTRLTRHYRIHTGEKPYECEYCSKSFSVKENLSVHRRIHTKERPYKCDVCESAFEHSGKLHRHMRIHTGERPHKCSLCNKTFIQSGQLVIHMRTHTGEKPYICISCGKGFTCSKQLKVHTRTHTGEKPYKCDICDKTFGYNHVLKLHQVAHYGEKFYKCTLCQQTFNSKKLMELHVKIHSDSLFSNSLKSTESVFKTFKDTKKIIFYNNRNVTYDNQMLIIENKKKKKTARITETTLTSEPPNLLLCNNSSEQHKRTNNKLTKFIVDKSYLSISTNSSPSKEMTSVRTEVNNPQDVATNSNISIYNGSFTDIIPNHTCVTEIQNNKLLSGEYLSSFCLSNNEVRQTIPTNLKLVEREQQQTSKKLETFTQRYCNLNDSAMYTNSLHLISPNARDTYSLPPRKRCKMILESMDIEKTELRKAGRHNSVIRFAKADTKTSINN